MYLLTGMMPRMFAANPRCLRTFISKRERRCVTSISKLEIMTSIANNPAARIAAIAVGLVLAFSAFAPVAQAAALTNDQVNAIITMIQSFGADAATVANVRVSSSQKDIQFLQVQPVTSVAKQLPQ